MKRTRVRARWQSAPLEISTIIILALLGAVQPATAREGRVVGNFDDWTLTDVGFSGAHDADAYVVNIANWFTRGAPGSFIGLGGTFHLGSSALADALTGAGHSYVLSNQQTFTLAELQAYDGVFLGAWPLGQNPNNVTALVQYVEGGGGVYIYGGTNFYGSIAADAAVLNAFAGEFGLGFSSNVDSYVGTYSVTGNHAILTGVQQLYAYNGTILSDLEPGNPQNEIIDSALGGAIAVFDGEVATTSVPQTAARYAIALHASPNPATHEFRLSLSPPSAGPVSVRIYSVSGQLVRELRAFAETPAQRIELIWDGRSSTGERVAGGVYFARPMIRRAKGISLVVLR